MPGGNSGQKAGPATVWVDIPRETLYSMRMTDVSSAFVWSSDAFVWGVDATAVIQQAIDEATAEALEKKVMSVMGIPVHVSSLVPDNLLLAGEGPYSLFEPREIKPKGHAEADKIYEGIIDEDFLLEFSEELTKKQKQAIKMMVYGGIEISGNTTYLPSGYYSAYSDDGSWGRIAHSCPGVTTEVSPPAECKCYNMEGPEHAREVGILVMHLNDRHAWSRERIADWLDSLEVDLTVQLGDPEPEPEPEPEPVSGIYFDTQGIKISGNYGSIFDPGATYTFKVHNPKSDPLKGTIA